MNFQRKQLLDIQWLATNSAGAAIPEAALVRVEKFIHRAGLRPEEKLVRFCVFKPAHRCPLPLLSHNALPRVQGNAELKTGFKRLRDADEPFTVILSSKDKTGAVKEPGTKRGHWTSFVLSSSELSSNDSRATDFLPGSARMLENDNE